MDENLALLQAWTNQLLRERVPDDRTAYWLLHELQTRGARAPIVVLEMGTQRWAQFAVAPHHAAAKKLPVESVTCSYTVNGRKLPFTGTKALRAVLLCEMVRTLPAAARKPVKTNSRAAQRLENLLAGSAYQNIVKVKVTPQES